MVGDESMLEERMRRVLDFERTAWGHSAGKETRIRREFGWSPARYYQVLNAAIETEAALRYDPVLVGRLHEVRSVRSERRRTRREPEAS